MSNKPSKKRLEKIPRLYKTEDVPLKKKRVHLHLFIGGCDWFICEYDGHDLFWGFAILNNDLDMAEWGYISFRELLETNISGIEIDCELEEYFPIRKASEIDKISKGNGWGNNNKPEIDLKELIRQAVMDNLLELPCPECTGTLRCEPDATESYCFECEKVVSTYNPLISMGLM